MAQAGLDVVNLSFGEFMTDDDAAPMVLAAAVRRFGPETVVVAAAGNNGDATRLLPGRVPPGVTPETKSYPAALPDVIGVGAIDEHGKLAPFTPRPAPWISLYTRGTDLNAAYLRGKVSVATGEIAADGTALHPAGGVPRLRQLGGVLVRGWHRHGRDRGRSHSGPAVRPRRAIRPAAPGPGRLLRAVC